MPLPDAVESRQIEQAQLAETFADLAAILEPLAGRFSTRSDFALAKSLAQDKISALDTMVRRSFSVDQWRQWNAKLEATKLPTWQQVKP